jgi:pyruvate/2-oxoglutarate/acetoin dehydrogenase E1 component
MRKLTFREAIREAMAQEMRRDETVFIMGEDVQRFYGGGAFAVTRGLVNDFGEERIRDTPISESAFIGAGVSAALTGMRPIVELMFVDFCGVCLDQICNQAAKLRYMSGGQAKVPLVIRTTIGAALSCSAQHSQCLYSMFAHFPGLKVVVPCTPFDAKGLLIEAIRDDDPVLFCEHKMLYDMEGEVPEEAYVIPFGRANVKRQGKDVTIVAVGTMVHKALIAASKLEEEGISIEVIDPRTIVPLDKETILESVRKTSRLVVVDEDYEQCGFAAEVAAIVADDGFSYLDAPIKRVATPSVPIPFSPVLESYVIPNEDAIVRAVKQIAS